MGAITIKTDNREHFIFLKTFLENLRWNLGIEYDDKDLSKNSSRDEFWEKVRNHKFMPAVMSIDEFNAEVLNATEELKNGMGIKHEDVMKELKTWM